MTHLVIASAVERAGWFIGAATIVAMLIYFVVSVEGETVVVDTKLIIPGPPLGTDTTGQQLEGPHCA